MNALGFLPAGSDAVLLQIDDFSVQFGAVTAVSSVRYSVKKGEVFVRVGPVADHDSLGHRRPGSRPAGVPTKARSMAPFPREVIRVLDRELPKGWAYVNGPGHGSFFSVHLNDGPAENFLTIREFGPIGNGLSPVMLSRSAASIRFRNPRAARHVAAAPPRSALHSRFHRKSHVDTRLRCLHCCQVQQHVLDADAAARPRAGAV